MATQRVQIHDRWSGTRVHKVLVLDTSAVLKIVKNEFGADEAMAYLKQSHWSLFCPAPVLLEVGLGTKAGEAETNFWMELSQTASEVFNRLSQARIFSINELTTSAVQMWIQMTNDMSPFSGRITLINPDLHNWLATKSSMTRLSETKTKKEKMSAYFMDSLIAMSATNLSAAVWTDNPDDFLLASSHHSTFQSSSKQRQKEQLLPVFTTFDMVNFSKGVPLVFPSPHMREKIKDRRVLKLFEP